MIHEEYGMRITSIEEKLSYLERITTEYTNDIKSLESKFVILEGELSELKNKTAFENKKCENIDEEIRKVDIISQKRNQ